MLSIFLPMYTVVEALIAPASSAEPAARVPMIANSGAAMMTAIKN